MEKATDSRNVLGRFMRNALLMSATALFLRAVGILFNAWWVKKTGTEALGLMSQIGGVFGFAATLASSGIHLAVTRLVAEEAAKGPDGRTDAVMRAAKRFCLISGTSACLVLFLFSDLIGRRILGDERIGAILRILALSLPAGAISSCLGGYLTAVRRVGKNVAAQLIAQFFRMGLLILAISGQSGAPQAGTVCLILAVCGTAAEWLGAALSFLFYQTDRSRVPGRHTEYPGVRGVLLRNALPLACSSYVRSGLLALEHILIPLCLVAHGGSRAQALADFGVLQGMALPVILFPTALIASVAGLLIPEFAELGAVGRDRIPEVCGRVMRMTLLFSFAAAGLLGGLSTEIGAFLYRNVDAARYILMLAPLIPVMYTDTIVDSMLKGLGQQVYSMNVNIADAFLSVVSVTVLLPRYGIVGYIGVIYLSELFNFALSLGRLIRVTCWKPDPVGLILPPLTATVIATRAALFLRRTFAERPTSLLFMLWEGGVTLAVFVLIAGLWYFLKKNKKKFAKRGCIFKSVVI